MSKQQWGHGFYSGKSEGFEEGFEFGKDCYQTKGLPMERVNILLHGLEQSLGKPESWLVLRMISETIAQHIATTPWHEDFDERQKAFREKRMLEKNASSA